MLCTTIARAILMTSLASLAVAHQMIRTEVKALPYFLVLGVFLCVMTSKFVLAAKPAGIVFTITAGLAK
jgi:hypothetical protein